MIRSSSLEGGAWLNIYNLQPDLTTYLLSINKYPVLNTVYSKLADIIKPGSVATIKLYDTQYCFSGGQMSYGVCALQSAKQKGYSHIVNNIAYVNAVAGTLVSTSDAGKLYISLTSIAYSSKFNGLAFDIEPGTNMKSFYAALTLFYQSLIPKVNADKYLGAPISVGAYIAPSSLSNTAASLSSIFNALKMNAAAKNYILIPLYDGNGVISKNSLDNAMQVVKSNRVNYKFIVRVSPIPSVKIPTSLNLKTVVQGQLDVIATYLQSSYYLGLVAYSWDNRSSVPRSPESYISGDLQGPAAMQLFCQSL